MKNEMRKQTTAATTKKCNIHIRSNRLLGRMGFGEELHLCIKQRKNIRSFLSLALGFHLVLLPFLLTTTNRNDVKTTGAQDTVPTNELKPTFFFVVIFAFIS